MGRSFHLRFLGSFVSAFAAMIAVAACGPGTDPGGGWRPVPEFRRPQEAHGPTRGTPGAPLGSSSPREEPRRTP